MFHFPSIAYRPVLLPIFFITKEKSNNSGQNSISCVLNERIKNSYLDLCFHILRFT
jgi:hypothetical protein